ncbi:MAG: signal peptide peptidase SppA [Pseudomonadota bacterium]
MKKYLLLILILAVSFVLNSCFKINIQPFRQEPKPASEYIIKPATLISTNDKVAVIDIEGSIGGGKCKPLSICAVGMMSVLAKIEQDTDVKALIINVNSPGGEVTITDIIYDSIMKLKKKKNIPVYTFVQRACFSGGYYIGLAADEIYALPTSSIGSIGVIWLSFELVDTLKKIGVKPVVIKSVKNKDLASPFKEMLPEERKAIQDNIDHLHNKFTNIVVDRRAKITKDNIDKIATGFVFTADDALEKGLIDGVMYYDEFLEKLKEKLELKDFNLVRYSLYKNEIQTYYTPHMSNDFPFSQDIGASLLNAFEETLENRSGYYYMSGKW